MVYVGVSIVVCATSFDVGQVEQGINHTKQQTVISVQTPPGSEENTIVYLTDIMI